jgi:hypothetical protein
MLGNLEVVPSVQPVVVLDDASDLALPPVLPVFGSTYSPGAVAGQYTTHGLQPGQLPIIVDWMTAASGNCYLGVNDGTLAPAGLSTVTPKCIQGPSGASPSTTVYGGTMAADITSNGNLHVPTSGTLRVDLGLIVLPGQYLYLQHGTANTAMEVRLVWVEIPVGSDAWASSLPRT